jgi:DNA-binding MarR family transcriptional regulator
VPDASSDPETRRRIAAAWRELRRGASGAALRSHLIGPGGPQVEQAQLDALEVLAAEPTGWRMGDFADAMHVDPSTATRAVARLEQLGLAERTRDPDDRRVVLARPTGLGRRTVSSMLVRRSIGMERLLETFTDDEQVAVRRIPRAPRRRGRSARRRAQRGRRRADGRAAPPLRR